VPRFSTATRRTFRPPFTVKRGKLKESTVKKYKAVLANFSSYIEALAPGMRMDAIKTSTIQNFMEHRAEQTRFGKGKVPITKSGVNKEVHFVSTVFKVAVKEGVIATSPVNENLEMFVIPRQRTREHEMEDIFSDAEVALILNEMILNEADVYPVVAAIAMTGARRAELYHLRQENVDFERNLIHIEPDPDTGWSPKNEASIRAVPMSPQLRELLEGLLKPEVRPQHAYVFQLSDGRPVWQWVDWPLRRLQATIRKLQKRGEKVRHGTLRMLRHWFISTNLNRRDNPINPVEMIRLVGHTDLSMLTKIYYHADMDAIGDKMRSFEIKDAPTVYGLRIISA